VRVTKTVGEYQLGSGAISHLGDMLSPHRSTSGPVVFFVDHYFENRNLIGKLPLENNDAMFFVDSTHEPTTQKIDSLKAQVRDQLGADISAVIAMGGGSTLDVGKAVANLLTNKGSAADYQGWDLVENPGIFKIGVPTLSGTGAEASRTCVMMNVEKNLKLGMNSDFTVYNRLVLDPNLSASVPHEQYFYTGMDTYIHCIESLNGSFRNAMADALSREALNLCREVFLSEDMMSAENREKLMVASYMGGSAIGNSFVGVVHPLSAGLSMTLGIHHCRANCIVMTTMKDFYPAETEEFLAMAERQGIIVEAGVSNNLTDQQHQSMYQGSIVHNKPLENALGENFKNILNEEKVRNLFEQM